MRLNVRGLLVVCLVVVFLEKEYGEVGRGEWNRYWILLDLDWSEEELCKEVVIVVVDCLDGGEMRVRSIEK